MTENLMDIKQLSEYLQMNKMTVYKLAREGKIPAFKVASEWRFRKDLIDAWLMSQVEDNPQFKKLKLEQKPKADKTVLVVDDDEVIRDFFERVLKDYIVTKASSGEEALEIIQKRKHSLVLLDLRMPGIDGIETLRRIKEIDSSIAVIMLSAFGSLRTNIEAAKLGAYSSLAKPFDLFEIKRILAEAIKTEEKSSSISGQPPSKRKSKRG